MKQQNHHRHCYAPPCSCNRTATSLRNPSVEEEGFYINDEEEESLLKTLAHHFHRSYIVGEEGLSDSTKSIQYMFDLRLQMYIENGGVGTRSDSRFRGGVPQSSPPLVVVWVLQMPCQFPAHLPQNFDHSSIKSVDFKLRPFVDKECRFQL
ncbi:unnamed protein product [Lactuca saligna]|uniref:Uncharacterized protein n=1 Tax=Lactuca saligna TaxID=75948 RepID=A0AA36EG44_LACSI|nr:unnamed protein product [Lactuca saligna]